MLFNTRLCLVARTAPAEPPLEPHPVHRGVLFLTKALFYRRIELLMQARFPDNDLRVYATPFNHVNDVKAVRVRRLCAG